MHQNYSIYIILLAVLAFSKYQLFSVILYGKLLQLLSIDIAVVIEIPLDHPDIHVVNPRYPPTFNRLPSHLCLGFPQRKTK